MEGVRSSACDAVLVSGYPEVKGGRSFVLLDLGSVILAERHNAVQIVLNLFYDFDRLVVNIFGFVNSLSYQFCIVAIRECRRSAKCLLSRSISIESTHPDEHRISGLTEPR